MHDAVSGRSRGLGGDLHPRARTPVTRSSAPDMTTARCLLLSLALVLVTQTVFARHMYLINDGRMRGNEIASAHVLSLSHLFCCREKLHELCTTKEIFKDIKGKFLTLFLFFYFWFPRYFIQTFEYHLCFRGIHQKTMSQCS